jgi:acetolactate synthase-1/2/3 large subunit
MINKHSKGDAIMVSDVGQHQMFACHCQIQFDKSNVTSGGLGTMGFALPAAIGAKMGMPDREVVAIMEMEVSNDHSRIRNYFPNQSSREIVVLNNEF